jgi:outer membrane protein TolC
VNLYPSVSIGTILGDLDVSRISLPAITGPVAIASPQVPSSGFLGLFNTQFSWNLLNYGRLANNVHLQQARTQELIAAYQNRVLAAAQEVQSALRGFLDSQEQAGALSGSAADAAAAARIGEDLFNRVKADANRLFILENTRLQTQDQLAVAQGNIALDLINVYRALGGGWQLRTQLELCGAGPTRSETCAAPVDAPALANGAPAPPAERLPGPVVPSK